MLSGKPTPNIDAINRRTLTLCACMCVSEHFDGLWCICKYVFSVFGLTYRTYAKRCIIQWVSYYWNNKCLSHALAKLPKKTLWFVSIQDIFAQPYTVQFFCCLSMKAEWTSSHSQYLSMVLTGGVDMSLLFTWTIFWTYNRVASDFTVVHYTKVNLMHMWQLYRNLLNLHSYISLLGASALAKLPAGYVNPL